MVRPDQAEAFIATLPVERFFGVGPVTARKMKENDIQTGLDLRERSEEDLVRLFGKAGRHYHRIARGIDEREVKPNRPYKSIGAETTFDTDLTDTNAMLERLKPLADRVVGRAATANAHGHTATLKIKYRDFSITTRQRTLERPVEDAGELMTLAAWLIEHPEPPAMPVRLIGISLSGFEPTGEARQLSFDDF